MGKKKVITVVPHPPADATDAERAACLAALEAVKTVRAEAATLTVRLEGRFSPANRAVVWRFHSIVSDNAARLVASVVATWNSRTCLVTVPGRTARFARTPAEALALGVEAVRHFRARGLELHAPKRKFTRAPKPAFPTRTGARKPVEDDNPSLGFDPDPTQW